MENQESINVPVVPVMAVRPGVITWFYVYCWILVVMYFLLMVCSLMFFFVSPEELEMEQTEALITGAVMSVSGAVFFVVGLLPLILRRRPWLWIYDLVIICLGMTSCCFWPVCIPLIVFWIKPGVKEYFAQPK